MRGRKRMRRSSIIILMLSCIALAAAVIICGPAHGKRKDGSNLKKVIAIGNVDMAQMGFNSMTPDAVGNLFRQKAKAQLEKTGRYIVVLPEPEKGSKKKSKAKKKTPKTPTTAAEAQQYMAQMMEMQKQMQTQVARSQGKYVHEPVAAQALFNFIASKGSSGFDTGGIFSTAESLGAPSGIGNADFSTDSIRVDLTCVMLDPEDGSVIDQHKARASTTKLTRVSGVSYYTVEDSANPDRAFNSMFRRALGKCAKWIDKKMKGEPWEGQVFKQKGSKLYVNAGSSAGIAEGMSFDAFSREEVAGKGVSLGAQDSRTGTVTVTSVSDAFSVATATSGTAGAGSILKAQAK